MTPLPSPLQALAEERLRALREQLAGQTGLPLPGDAHRVLACSDFVANACARNRALLPGLLASGDLARAYSPDEYRRQCQTALSSVSSEEALFPVLRQIRQREMARIAWRDLAGIANIEESMRDLSALADALIDGTLDKLHGWFCQRFGAPHAEDGDRQRLVVLGMGKLGGQELNFSSDVDLIFAYPHGGHTVPPGSAHGSGARGRLSNEEFFTRLGRRLVQLLSHSTEDGLVFRVDMRLRPFGASGPLVGSFGALENYYQVHGRDWERYALIRARPVAGDMQAGEQLLEALRPFIYRRYLDFGAIDALREMKTLIAREGRNKGYQENVKLGPGGIREIEFLAQALQMIHGGRVKELRARPTLTVLARLGERGYLPKSVTEQLSESYRFLRILEHRLQEAEDRQTHELPEDDPARARLAAGMGFQGWPELARAIAQHRANVQQHFDSVLAETAPSLHNLSTLLAMDKEQGADILRKLGFPDGEDAWEAIRALSGDTPLRFLTERGRTRFEKLIPHVLGAVARVNARTDAAGTTLHRVFQVLEAIGRRSVYFALLLENPVALAQLVRLCAASPWITRRIAHSPVLLDELLSPDTLYAPQDRAALEADLAFRLEQAAPGDTEQEINALRRFKQASVLRIAAADVCGVMPLMIVSDHLTDIAEVSLRAVLRLAWRDLVKRHGRPEETDGAGPEDSGFLIVAYGKLGGLELGYGSDLDLVFLYDAGQADQYTDGKKPLENSVFFARLGQRIIHFLTTRTASGILYEVDARLRPSGRSGALVSNMQAFADYQRREAWIWEHQALARARPVAGDSRLAWRFHEIRSEILKKTRDPEQLRRAVCEMRARMRKELDRTRQGVFDLKQGPGGITDIEFMVQYATLCWADRLGAYLGYSDNIRLLEGMAKAGLMDERDADALAEAYRRYRARVHALALQEQEVVVEETEGIVFAEERARVSKIWAGLMGDCSVAGA